MAETKGAQPIRPPAGDAAPLYSEDRVWDLPGFFWKRVTIQPGEMGLLLEKGQVQRSLHPGRYKVGWRFLNFGPQHRAVGRWRTGAFSLPLRFYRLGDDRDEPLDAFTQATVVVTDPIRFYQVAVAGRQHLTATQLGSAVTEAVQNIVDQLAASFDPATLQRDPAAQEQLTNQVAPLLEEQLRDRGLRLEQVYPLVFRPSRESEALLEEALVLQSELASPGAKDWAQLRARVERFASHVLSIEQASSEMEALQAAASMPSSDPGSLMVGFMQRWVERLTGQVSDRAQRLTVQAQGSAASGPYGVSLTWLNNLLGWVVLGAVLLAVALAVPIYLFKNRFAVDPQVYLGVPYGTLFVIISAATFCRWAIDQWERWRQKQIARAASGPAWFEQWLTRDAPRVDELMRHQVATELEQGPEVDLQDVMRLKHEQRRTPEAQSARQLGEQVHYLAQSFSGAAYASTALPADGQRAVRQGARLVTFEEESLRLARSISARVRELKAATQSGAETAGHFQQVEEAIGALRRHFANRAIVLAGGPASILSTSPQQQ